MNDKNSWMFTEESKLNKIIGNLLDNALKFTNEGFIELGYQLIQNEGAKCIQIYVKDTGIGTVVAMMLPYSVGFLIAWTAFLLLYWLVGLPLGLSASYAYP